MLLLILEFMHVEIESLKNQNTSNNNNIQIILECVPSMRIFLQVPRDYEAFETLQKELLENFSSLKLPALPRKYHIFMSESDIEERQISFDCLLMLVARTPDMCTSIPVLKFLGVDLIADKKYRKKRPEYLEAQTAKKDQEKKRQEKILGKKGEEDDEGLFGEERTSGRNGKDDSDSEDLFGSDLSGAKSQTESGQ